MTAEKLGVIPGSESEALLREIAGWGRVTTIILHGGCVFEFKGDFPQGESAEDFYNLDGTMPGFHGHLNLNLIAHIAFQDKPHRGRNSYALVFENKHLEVIFKIFLGRDDNGEIDTTQLTRFKQLQQQYLSE